MLSDYVQSADWKNEKHIPVILCPDCVQASEPFEIEVAVGKEIPHPNTPTHFIAWIALHFVPADSHVSIELGRFEMSAHGASASGDGGPAITQSKIKCSVALRKPGKLFATSYCNIHGLWTSEKSVSVR